MGEGNVIDSTKDPFTKDVLLEEFHSIGIKKGMTLFLQSSLSSIGWVCGGPVTVIDALIECIGKKGTLVMPSMSGDYSEPSLWKHPPVPEPWWNTIRETMPAFNPCCTPTRSLGAIAEAFRGMPDVFRSNHPTCSLAAWGDKAESIVADHRLPFGLGKNSPLERCVENGGMALLLGTERNTTLHLAEYYANVNKEVIIQGSPVLKDGKRVWIEYPDHSDYSDHFPAILKEYILVHPESIVNVGNAQSYYFNQKSMVEYGIKWLENHIF